MAVMNKRTVLIAVLTPIISTALRGQQILPPGGTEWGRARPKWSMPVRKKAPKQHPVREPLLRLCCWGLWGKSSQQKMEALLHPFYCPLQKLRRFFHEKHLLNYRKLNLIVLQPRSSTPCLSACLCFSVCLRQRPQTWNWVCCRYVVKGAYTTVVSMVITFAGIAGQKRVCVASVFIVWSS